MIESEGLTAAPVGSDEADGETGRLTRQQFFLPMVGPEAVLREKEKARALKRTRWWQRQIDRGVCFYCQQPVARDQVTLDHIVPLIRGGQSTRSNVVLACKACNSRKKYLLPMEWEEYLRAMRLSTGADPAAMTAVSAPEEQGDE